MTKKYLLFAGPFYYPGGGWEDFIGSYRSIDEAKKAFDEQCEKHSDINWAHIVDVDTGKRILENIPGMNNMRVAWVTEPGAKE